jgi:hypothetical protein
MTARPKFCDGLARRDMLRLGVAGFGAGAFGLPDLLAARESKGNTTDKDVSLIILFLKGGLSTIDTLDLKPNAPAEFRGDFRPADTVVPGMQIVDLLPRAAKQADKYSLLRSFTHQNSGHGQADHYMLTGYHPRPGFNPSLKPNNQRPAYGAMMAHKLGPKGSVPPYVCLPKMHASGGSAYLGSAAAPFVVESDPSAPNFKVPDLVPPPAIDANRLDDRKGLLSTIDRFRKSAEIEANSGVKTLTTFQRKAFELISSAATKSAFDINQESVNLRDEYGRHSLGQSCLMARRLVEAGVRCVTIDHTNWDTHYNNFRVLKNDLLPQLDSGMTTLFRDLDDRGMLESTMVLVMGEFGRTPRVNKHAGRDHWGPSNTVLLGGGGVQGGRVVGATNSRGEKPAADPISPEDLAATVYRCVGIDPEELFYTAEGRPVKVVNDGRAISDVL